MRIAILSDTHDNIWALRGALPHLAVSDVILHCGDLCSPFVVKLLGEGVQGRPVHVVWGNNEGDVPTEPPAAQPPAAGTGSFLERALAGEFKRTKVTATGPFVDQDAQKFDATMKAFEDKTGIDIQYQGSKEFEASIKAAMDSGTAPDVIDIPQPGLLASFARQGKIVDMSKFLDQEALKKNYNQSWLDMAMVPGKDGTKIMGGVWERVNGKSLVWYPKKAWDEAGYAIPQTWEEMKTLMDQMVADGSTSLCSLVDRKVS